MSYKTKRFFQELKSYIVENVPEIFFSSDRNSTKSKKNLYLNSHKNKKYRSGNIRHIIKSNDILYQLLKNKYKDVNTDIISTVSPMKNLINYHNHPINIFNLYFLNFFNDPSKGGKYISSISKKEINIKNIVPFLRKEFYLTVMNTLPRTELYQIFKKISLDCPFAVQKNRKAMILLNGKKTRYFNTFYDILKTLKHDDILKFYYFLLYLLCVSNTKLRWRQRRKRYANYSYDFLKIKGINKTKNDKTIINCSFDLEKKFIQFIYHSILLNSRSHYYDQASKQQRYEPIMNEELKIINSKIYDTFMKNKVNKNILNKEKLLTFDRNDTIKLNDTKSINFLSLISIKQLKEQNKSHHNKSSKENIRDQSSFDNFNEKNDDIQLKAKESKSVNSLNNIIEINDKMSNFSEQKSIEYEEKLEKLSNAIKNENNIDSINGSKINNEINIYNNNNMINIDSINGSKINNEINNTNNKNNNNSNNNNNNNNLKNIECINNTMMVSDKINITKNQNFRHTISKTRKKNKKMMMKESKKILKKFKKNIQKKLKASQPISMTDLIRYEQSCKSCLQSAELLDYDKTIIIKEKYFGYKFD
ncbi:hypothetical protein LY90DRAFT_643007 [Neocallimastix californiae]|uniref:Uncharacterized protein n=1 Tax=Neocallimastix californiae TaxID=1754190 RepID=A0A1Y2DP61_9FUNG|nr:hypothetical protein LY90DRAFT_643007 [Neocallimastix californiae]|eukprot:ORY61083.1 hypothetical protein LY90DRAFT_643007 [Neocallimastix californiae]